MAVAPERSSASAQRLDGIIALALSASAVAQSDDAAALDQHLDSVDPDFLGFAVEGAGMGLTLLDRRSPVEPSRLRRLQKGRWLRFVPLAYAGAGLGLAELGQAVIPYVEDEKVLTAWFAIDGYAFHLTLLAPEDHLDGQAVPPELSGPAAMVFDQGVARCIWFNAAAEPGAIGAIVGRFPPQRQADLWSGVGLAATYAGGLDPDGLAELRKLSGPHAAMLASGSVFASWLRVLGENEVPGNRTACQALTGMTIDEAAELCLVERRATSGESIEDFLGWHGRVRQALAGR